MYQLVPFKNPAGRLGGHPVTSIFYTDKKNKNATWIKTARKLLFAANVIGICWSNKPLLSLLCSIWGR